jgi:phage virion morphogenesis protein
VAGVTDDLDRLRQLAGDLLVSMAPAERRRILRAVAADWRRSQAARIARQQNPDGSAFAPRKAQGSRLRRQGQIRKGAMFRKLRQTKHLKKGATADEAWVGFSGRAARIARVNQEGLPDKPTRNSQPVRYARRILLGLTEEEQIRAVDLVIEQFTNDA